LPVRPERDDIGAPEFPDRIKWVGKPPDSMAALTAAGPVLIHFMDFAQLNSVRTLPYVVEWERRYRDTGLEVIGVQAPRFPFGSDPEAVRTGLARLEVDFPVAVDARRDLWHLYGCSGWPSLFIWGQGGALRWAHFGEGEYRATEEAIQEELRESDALQFLPATLDPIRPTDTPGAKVIPPSQEAFPGGEDWQHPWTANLDSDALTYDYSAGGAHVTAEGVGTLEYRLDRGEPRQFQVDGPALYTVAEHARHETHQLALHPEEDLQIWSVSFSAGLP
jgi:hypothetical protein